MAPMLNLAAPPSGGIGAIRSRVTIEIAKVQASVRYAAGSPTTAMRTPPTAGPRTLEMFQLTCEIETAHGTSSRGTTRNIADERAGWSIAEIAPATNPTA